MMVSEILVAIAYSIVLRGKPVCVIARPDESRRGRPCSPSRSLRGPSYCRIPGCSAASEVLISRVRLLGRMFRQLTKGCKGHVTEVSMIRTALVLLAGCALWAQQQPTGAPTAPKRVAVRAGKLFDPKSGKLLSNEVVLVSGERLIDVGPAGQVSIPPDVQVVDLSNATVLPGLIDQHLHVMERAQRTPDGKRNPPLVPRVFPDSQLALDSYMDWVLQAAFEAQKDLNAGFTTVVDMGALGGSYGTVTLRDAINKGLIQGPRMRVAGPMLNEVDPKIDSIESARQAVRELAEHHADWVKITSTGQYTLNRD